MTGSILFGLAILAVFTMVQTIKPGQSLFDRR
jgi:hypothetical protein